MKFLSIIVFTPILLMTINCHKVPSIPKVLPEATQIGKNTIGFVIDGEVWLPYHKCSFSSDPCEQISARYGGPYAAPGSIDFSFARMRNNKLSYLVISAPFATITFPGDKIDSVGVTYSAENRSGNSGAYSGILPGSKFIITKLDSVNKIISGTFDFILAEDYRSGGTIELKQGRFDLTLNACICSD